jgi:hypothetical protein
MKRRDHGSMTEGDLELRAAGIAVILGILAIALLLVAAATTLTLG